MAFLSLELFSTIFLIAFSKYSSRKTILHYGSFAFIFIWSLLKIIIFLALAIHAFIILNHVSNKKFVAKEIEVTHSLSKSIVSGKNNSFRVVDNDEVIFSLVPGVACRENMVLMVLSAPNNVEKRNQMRTRLREVEDVKLIFLLGLSKKHQRQLDSEHEKHNDIVQATVLDSYDTLSYKSLFGFLWINQNCPDTKYITKTDDDVTLDVNLLKKTLKTKYGDDPPDIMECPSVIRNMRPLAQNHTGTIMAKFFITSYELQRRVYPDLCFGWLYVTTPRVGLALAEVAATNHEELRERANRDDYFITGFLREKLPWISLRQLDGGIFGAMWDNFFPSARGRV